MKKLKLKFKILRLAVGFNGFYISKKIRNWKPRKNMSGCCKGYVIGPFTADILGKKCGCENSF